MGNRYKTGREKERYKEELEAVCKAKTCLEARTPSKLLKGITSLGKKALPTDRDSGICVYMALGSGKRDKMYKDSPENESLEACVHMPCMAKTQGEKIQSRKCNFSKPG